MPQGPPGAAQGRKITPFGIPSGAVGRPRVKNYVNGSKNDDDDDDEEKEEKEEEEEEGKEEDDVWRHPTRVEDRDGDALTPPRARGGFFCILSSPRSPVACSALLPGPRVSRVVF